MTSKKTDPNMDAEYYSLETPLVLSLVQESSKHTFGKIEKCLKEMEKLIEDLQSL